MEHFTVYACTADQLDELRSTLFWAEDTDPALLEGILFPDDVPNWLVYQQFAGALFTDSDFFCTAS